MIRDQAADHFFTQGSGTCHARNLQRRVGRGDVRVQPAAGAGHGINENRKVARQPVALAVFLGQLPDTSENPQHRSSA